MENVKSIIFDMDDTIWNFQANFPPAIKRIWAIWRNRYGIKLDSDKFLELYEENNHFLWDEYAAGKRSSESIGYTRYMLLGKALGLDFSKEQAMELNNEYLDILYEGQILMPGARETLAGLAEGFKIGLITNGFVKGLYRLKNCDIEQYFTVCTVSAAFGIPKPEKEIFIHTAEKLGLLPEECVYVGDNYHGDILGAIGAGMKAIYYNPHEKSLPENVDRPDAVIKDLRKLLTMF